MKSCILKMLPLAGGLKVFDKQNWNRNYMFKRKRKTLYAYEMKNFHCVIK